MGLKVIFLYGTIKGTHGTYAGTHGTHRGTHGTTKGTNGTYAGMHGTGKTLHGTFEGTNGTSRATLFRLSSSETSWQNLGRANSKRMEYPSRT